MSTLGSRLRLLRSRRTQAQTATVFGVKQPTYCAWENDAKEPSLATLARICEHYSVSSDWLLGLSTSSEERAGTMVSQLRDAHDAFFKVTEAVNLLGKSLKGIKL